MVGVTFHYLDGGVTLDAYYQLEQKEIEIDPKGSFFGSDFVGGIVSTDLLNYTNRKTRSMFIYLWLQLSLRQLVMLMAL